LPKTPKTLEADINHVLNTGEGYTKEIAEWVGGDIAKSLGRQLRQPRKWSRNLRLSSLGTPCERKLWYSVNWNSEPEPLPPNDKNKFIFGDLTESHMLGLVMAAGHTVEGLQTQVDVFGIKGHRDCVIDGMLFDVKSSSAGSFGKFRENGLRNDDPFGYLSQISSYLYGSLSDDIVTNKEEVGFLAFNKETGHVAVDIYEVSNLVSKKEEEVKRKKEIVKQKEPPERLYKPVDQYRRNPNGNMKLSTACKFCGYKFECWPEVRKFLYSNGPEYLTKVEKEPQGRVLEVKR